MYGGCYYHICWGNLASSEIPRHIFELHPQVYAIANVLKLFHQHHLIFFHRAVLTDVCEVQESKPALSAPPKSFGQSPTARVELDPLPN